MAKKHVNTTYIKSIRKELHDYALVRRDVIKMSGDALHHAKRAIFSLHRGEQAEAKKKLEESKKLFEKLHKKYKRHTGIKSEGAYKAGLEEYVEATLFYQFVTKGTIGKVTDLPVKGEVFLAGLCDVPGELYRYAVRAATMGDVALVESCEEVSSEILAELIEFDLTKYLRTKLDQAKHAQQKLEIILYELSIRKK